MRQRTVNASTFSFAAVLLLIVPATSSGMDLETTEALQALREARRSFQAQELITASPAGHLFSPGSSPRIVWRDADAVRDLGCTEPLHVRWFDADLQEETIPTRPGRWGAWISTTAPNGLPFHRSMPFFCRPPMYLLYMPREPKVDLSGDAGPVAPEVWSEHQAEVTKTAQAGLLRELNQSEEGAILFTGLSEAEPLNRKPTSLESAVARNEDYHLALKLKVMNLSSKVRPLSAPRRRSTPAPVLHVASEGEAGFKPGAKERLDAISREWAAATEEPFVTLVARHGAIITHEAFGTANGSPVTLDYRADVASITKTVTAILFAQFLDQGLLKLDDPVSVAFPDYPLGSPHVPTFRHCFHHVSGIEGHGTWGGVRHPHLENIILNGLDALRPGSQSIYAGLNLDIIGKAMENVSGKTARRLLYEHLFQPLGLGDIPMGDLGAGLQPTAYQLGVLAQWLANRGSYGDLEFVSEETFQKMLPEELSKRYPGVPPEQYGLALGCKPDLRLGAALGTTSTHDLIFSPGTLSHGSLTQCILRVDPERDVIVVQVRRGGGKEPGDWARRYLQAVADEIIP